MSQGSETELRAKSEKLVPTRGEEPLSFTLEDLLGGITEESLHPEIRTGPAVRNEFA